MESALGRLAVGSEIDELGASGSVTVSGVEVVPACWDDILAECIVMTSLRRAERYLMSQRLRLLAVCTGICDSEAGF